MSAMHTPGPWVHTNNVSEERFADIESVNDLLYIRAQWGSMPRLKKGQKKELQKAMEANARLIAAAPDLLAACKRLLVEVRWEAARADVVTDGARADIALAEAAIAKATGVAP